MCTYLKTRLEKVDGISEEPGNDSGHPSCHQHVESAQRFGRITSTSHGLVAGKVEAKGGDLSGDGDV